MLAEIFLDESEFADQNNYDYLNWYILEQIA